MSAVDVTLVTGAGRGIGAQIARTLARSHPVVLAARTREQCESVAAEIRATGGEALALELDVGDPRSIASAVARASEWCAGRGELVRLVNNAGIAISAPLLAKPGTDPDELYERHMRVNFHGARRVAEALLPRMKELRRGAVIQIASSAALTGYAYVAAYCASKHALLGWARAAARELEGSGVRIATVCPHYVDSPMTDESVRRIVEKTGRTPAQAREFFAQQNPSGRLVTPEQISTVVAEWFERGENGAVIELDGAAARYHPRATP